MGYTSDDHPVPTDLQLLIREFDPEDANFILKTWLRSYRNRIHTCPDGLYYEKQQLLIRRLAARSRVAIAVNRDTPDFIMGFTVAEPLQGPEIHVPLLVHFCFTKLSYRRNGLARAMLRHVGWNDGRPIHLSHWTQAARDLNEQGKFTITYNPFSLMELPDAPAT